MSWYANMGGDAAFWPAAFTNESPTEQPLISLEERDAARVRRDKLRARVKAGAELPLDLTVQAFYARHASEMNPIERRIMADAVAVIANHQSETNQGAKQMNPEDTTITITIPGEWTEALTEELKWESLKDSEASELGRVKVMALAAWHKQQQPPHTLEAGDVR